VAHFTHLDAEKVAAWPSRCGPLFLTKCDTVAALCFIMKVCARLSALPVIREMSKGIVERRLLIVFCFDPVVSRVVRHGAASFLAEKSVDSK
jgi:hypothetical protein